MFTYSVFLYKAYVLKLYRYSGDINAVVITHRYV